jgi:hypothetical protein
MQSVSIIRLQLSDKWLKAVPFDTTLLNDIEAVYNGTPTTQKPYIIATFSGEDVFEA